MDEPNKEYNVEESSDEEGEPLEVACALTVVLSSLSLDRRFT